MANTKIFTANTLLVIDNGSSVKHVQAKVAGNVIELELVGGSISIRQGNVRLMPLTPYALLVQSDGTTALGATAVLTLAAIDALINT